MSIPKKYLIDFLEKRVEPLFKDLVDRQLLVSFQKDKTKPTIIDLYTKITKIPNLLGSLEIIRHTDRVLYDQIGRKRRIDRSTVSVKCKYVGYDFSLLFRTRE